MTKLIESIHDNGVLVPVLVRPDKDGKGYEMVSGHRRMFALEKQVRMRLMLLFVN